MRTLQTALSRHPLADGSIVADFHSGRNFFGLQPFVEDEHTVFMKTIIPRGSGCGGTDSFSPADATSAAPRSQGPNPLIGLGAGGR